MEAGTAASGAVDGAAPAAPPREPWLLEHTGRAREVNGLMVARFTPVCTGTAPDAAPAAGDLAMGEDQCLLPEASRKRKTDTLIARQLGHWGPKLPEDSSRLRKRLRQLAGAGAGGFVDGERVLGFLLRLGIYAPVAD